MKYIHDSPVGCHGHLRSDVCLIDSRWVLKVADVGINWLRYAGRFTSDNNDEEYKGTTISFRLHVSPRANFRDVYCAYRIINVYSDFNVYWCAFFDTIHLQISRPTERITIR